MADIKNKLRKQLLMKRNTFLGRHAANKIIFDKLVSECKNYNKIFIYISYGSEADTLDFINKMLDDGKELFVPVCNVVDCTMRASRINNMKKLSKNSYGILEPNEYNFTDEKFDLVIFPGVAFDLSGNRIGYGKGYYDRFIHSLSYDPYKIGLCYDFQLLDKFLSESHDVKMDKIITESRVVSV